MAKFYPAGERAYKINRESQVDVLCEPNNRQTYPVRVSAVIITFNEARIIAKTLSKLWWCDEIIIIDSGSTDTTIDICREAGCAVYHRPFNGFGPQKKYGVSKAKNDWILCIDADEILTDELIAELTDELCKSEMNVAGYAISRNLVFMNQVFQFGKEANDRIVRLFNRTKGNWDDAAVHETVQLNGPVKKLKNKILHYSYHGYTQLLDKINLYSTLGAKKLYGKKSGKSKVVLALSIPFNFFKYYIIDRNFLNGFHGFTWAALNAFYHYVKYLKLTEMLSRAAANRE